MGPTAHVAVAFEGVPWDSPDVIAFMLMQSIIGTYRKDEGIIPGMVCSHILHLCISDVLLCIAYF